MLKIGFVLLLSVGLLFGLTAESIAADDLQKTVAQLQKMLREQQRQIDALKKKVGELESYKAAPVSGWSKGVTKSGNDKVMTKIYGQVNRGILIANDGNSTEVMHVDNDNSSTRIGFEGMADITNDVSVGTKIEVQFESNSTYAVSQDDQSVGPNNFTERHFDLFLQSKRLGKLSVGQGDTASNGSSEVDLSGTAVVGYSGVEGMDGGLKFYDEDANALSSTTILSVMNNMDGLSRRDRVRYDTPELAGFQLSGSLAEDDQQDVGLRYSGELGGFKLAGAVAYANRDQSSIDDQINGSLSFLHDKGFNLTIAGGFRDMDASNRDDATFWYTKIGYRAEMLDLGETAFALDYGKFNDISMNDDKAYSIGAFVVQQFPKISTELYLGYRWNQLDRPGSEFDEINAVLIGARVKF